MTTSNEYDIIIIGGSYAGLSAAMALGRSLKNVLIIDSGQPCNKQTPHSHNFITHDGETPAAISKKAKEQVLKYDTVTFVEDKAIKATKTAQGFEMETEAGKTYHAKKLIFTTGVKDLLPETEGYKECWGISIIHCPYCHGYEVKGEATGLLMNGDMAFEMAKFISNWTHDLTLFTNGVSTLTAEQTEKLRSKKINIVEKEIKQFEHINGYLTHVLFTDGSRHPLKAMYARPAIKQHCDIPEQLGCTLSEQGYILVDTFQKTTVPGIYAAGDCTIMFRSVSKAVSEGTMAGAMLNKEWADENF